MTHHSGKAPINFGVKRLKVKVTGEGILHLPTNSFPGNNSCLHMLIITCLHVLKNLFSDDNHCLDW